MIGKNLVFFNWIENDQPFWDKWDSKKIIEPFHSHNTIGNNDISMMLLYFGSKKEKKWKEWIGHTFTHTDTHHSFEESDQIIIIIIWWWCRNSHCYSDWWCFIFSSAYTYIDDIFSLKLNFFSIIIIIWELRNN